MKLENDAHIIIWNLQLHLVSNIEDINDPPPP